MIINRMSGHAPRSTRLAQQMAVLTGPCIGCKGCTGLCQALIEAITLPDVILRKD